MWSIACPIASYEATFYGHEKYLARGEQAVIPPGDRVVFGYIKSHFIDSPLLRSVLEEENRNCDTGEVRTPSARL